MIDISTKQHVLRVCTAEGYLRLSEAALEAIKRREVKKGDPIETARTAALLAVKRTPELIPHCHPLPVTSVRVDIDVADRVAVRCEVSTVYRTGVEMEALVGVSAALLTLWDMVKYLEKDADGQYPHTRIEDIRVVRKVKGNGT